MASMFVGLVNLSVRNSRNRQNAHLNLFRVMDQ